MFAPGRILCSQEGIWLIGRKNSYKDDLAIKKYSWQGSLASEITLKNTAELDIRQIVGFRDEANHFAIEFITKEQEKGLSCKKLIFKNILPGTNERIINLQEETEVLFNNWLPGCSGL